MLGILISFIAAGFKGARDVVSKRALKKAPVFAVLSISTFVAFIASIPFALQEPMPHLNTTFYITFIVSLMMVFIGQSLYMKAIKISEISHVVPLIAFSPVFTVIFSAFMLGEIPSLAGFLGVMIIVLGSYISNIDPQKVGILTPFRDLKDHYGARLMLIVAALWTINPVIEKIGINQTNSFFWASASLLFLSCMYTVLAIQRGSFQKLSKKYYGFIVLLGLLQGVSYVAQLFAYTLTFVGYVISIKRMSMLFSIVFGYLFFKEKNFKQRLVGGVIMLAGVLLVVLA